MEKRDYIKLDPEEKDRILILDSDRKIYLSKAPKNCAIIIELPDGAKEKCLVQADTEYIIYYDKRHQTSQIRQLMGEVKPICEFA